ncbi:MAG TPA: hypothetical protein VKX16_13525 [Chloroflexota bacterium]|nr:hypothetical protein [Chloroflexota bacterium]
MWQIILLLLLGPPGWLALFVWWATTWNRETALLVFGFIFPPLWVPLVWGLRLATWLKVALTAGIVAGNTVWLFNLTHTWTAPAVALVVTMILGLAWIVNGMRTVPKADPYITALCTEIQRDLDACHDLIAQIEDDLLLTPAGAPITRKYAHALEMRAQGADLWDRAETEPELVQARRSVGSALSELREVRREARVAGL